MTSWYTCKSVETEKTGTGHGENPEEDVLKKTDL